MTETATDERVDSEAWFLEQLTAEPIPARPLLGSLRRLIDRGAVAQAEARAKLLQDMLADAGRADEALEALALRLEDGMPPVDARTEARAIVGPDRRRQAYLADAGFDDEVPAREAVRRLRVLLQLDEGCLCYDKTWGFGVVRGNDHFERRVEVDFERRAGHRMARTYAAQSLQILDEEHLLARSHREPETIAAMVAGDPAALVRLALRSFGPMPAAILQEQLSPRFVEPGDWKRFWEAARKELKKDPLVALPARRTEPMALRDRAEDFGPAWRAALGAERDMDTILTRVVEWREAVRPEEADAEARTALAERLAFVIRGSGRRTPARTARAVLLAEACGVDGPQVDVDEWTRRFAEPALFLPASRALPAREVRPFLALLHRRLGAAFLDRLPALLPQMEMTAFAEAMDLLLGEGREAEAAAEVRDLITRVDEAPEALLWLVKHPDRQAAWCTDAPIDWLRHVLAALEREQSGDRLRAQNALRDRVGRVEWMGAWMERLDARQRREVILRVRESPAWPILERQALAGLLVKRFPELEEALAEAVSATPVAAEKPRTSTRSYRERQAQLERLVREEIPRNSREIGVARSYGDLRENFEYKAAKEMQTVLMRRQAELEEQLQSVVPSDFDGSPADRVAAGCAVELTTDGDAPPTVVHLLGVWDRDEALRIVSSETDLARALLGRGVGEEVHLPTEHGTRPARIAAIRPLPPEVRAWIRGEA